MTKFMAQAAAVFGMVSVLATAAVAAPKHKMAMHHKPVKKVETKAVYCPVCHMKLATHANQYRPTAVRLSKKSPIMYCCSKCKMPASVLVKKVEKKSKMKMHNKMHSKMKMHGKMKMHH